MNYNEKLASVLFATAMATPEDLDRLSNMTMMMIPDPSASKQQIDRADLCSYIPYLDANVTELITTSARMCRKK